MKEKIIQVTVPRAEVPYDVKFWNIFHLVNLTAILPLENAQIHVFSISSGVFAVHEFSFTILKEFNPFPCKRIKCFHNVIYV